MERQLTVNKGWASTNIWEVIEKIQYLKFKKITWPNDLGGEDIWIVTVNGTHIWLYRPDHPSFSQDSDYYSHKFNKAGINYELGIAIASGKLIWLNGPFNAGKNDLQIFVGGGPRERLKQLGKKAIGDGIYRGNQDTVSYGNSHDSRQVKKFKSRALKRHKDFNGMTKTFKILQGPFRHGPNKIARDFEAISVICQYKIERDEPLFDILIDNVLMVTMKTRTVIWKTWMMKTMKKVMTKSRSQRRAQASTRHLLSCIVYIYVYLPRVS
jgi:hypothetical protein